MLTLIARLAVIILVVVIARFTMIDMVLVIPSLR